MKKHSLNKTLLVVDDDRLFCDTVKDYFYGEKLEVYIAATGAEGIDICSKGRIDVILLDQKLPDGEGHAFCPSMLRHNDQTKIIFITAYPSFKSAVNAIKAGAYDYLSKPFELEELRIALEHAIKTIDLEKVGQIQEYKNLKESEEVVLVGKGLGPIRTLTDLAASADAPVLITGETGTGKNVVAKSIHYKSFDKTAPFISINCSALPENLIEAELFGYEKGSFTGAVTSRKGILEMAEGGTLLLDEIGEMPIHLQAKLLSVLEDKNIMRIGGESVKPIDVRIIATTNIDLEDAVKRKVFRQDLYYRLSVMRIHLPPLRDRREDIPELCAFLIKKITGRQIRITDSEIEKLMGYEWPGNVRELKNVIERSLIVQRGVAFSPSEFLGETSRHSKNAAQEIPATGNVMTLREIERQYICRALDVFSKNYTQTARALGISLSTLKRKMGEYDITRA